MITEHAAYQTKVSGSIPIQTISLLCMFITKAVGEYHKYIAPVKNSVLYHLQNPRDGGAWWAAFYGVTQSQTRLKCLSSSSSSKSHQNLISLNTAFTCSFIHSSNIYGVPSVSQNKRLVQKIQRQIKQHLSSKNSCSSENPRHSNCQI